MDAMCARFSDLNVRLMDHVRPEVLERLEIGLSEGRWPEDIQQQLPQLPDSTGGQNPNHLKLVAAMRDATFKKPCRTRLVATSTWRKTKFCPIFGRKGPSSFF